MPLIKCPEPDCDRMVSSLADKCPACGAPIASSLGGSVASTSSPPGPGNQREMRVAADGSGDAPSLQEALKRVADGGVIRLLAGVYNEAIELTRPVTILGDSGGKQPVIQIVGKRLLTVRETTAILRGVTLHCIDPKSATEKSFPEDNVGVWCKGGHLSAEGCRIVCEGGQGLLVDGDGSQATLTDCELEGSIAVTLTPRGSAKMVRTTLNSKYPVTNLSPDASLSLTECKLRGSSMETNGELTIKDSSIEVELFLTVSKSSRFLSTNVTFAGGVMISDSASVAFHKSSITGGSTMMVGGSSQAEFRDCSLSSEYNLSCSDDARITISGGNGSGGIMASGKARLKMEKANWECGDSSNSISIMEEAKAEIESCQIEGRVSCTDTARVEMTNSRVQVPQSKQYGSALSLSENGKTILGNCEILGNISSNGVSACDSHDLQIRSSKISGHSKAIWLYDRARATIEGCDLRGNSVPFDVEERCRLHQSRNRV
jgi:hypothetical protein